MKNCRQSAGGGGGGCISLILGSPFLLANNPPSSLLVSSYNSTLHAVQARKQYFALEILVNHISDRLLQTCTKWRIVYPVIWRLHARHNARDYEASSSRLGLISSCQMLEVVATHYAIPPSTSFNPPYPLPPNLPFPGCSPCTMQYTLNTYHLLRRS